MKKISMLLSKITNKAVIGSMHNTALAKAVELFNKIKHVNLCRIRISCNKT